MPLHSAEQLEIERSAFCCRQYKIVSSTFSTNFDHVRIAGTARLGKSDELNDIYLNTDIMRSCASLTSVKKLQVLDECLMKINKQLEDTVKGMVRCF